MWPTIFGVVGSVVGVATVIVGFATLRKMIDQTTAADQSRAEEKHADEIKDARQDERDKCRERTARILAELAEMTTDRNRQSARADALQQQINERGLGPR